MTGTIAAAYKSGAQRARVVTEAWGEANLYCPNCPAPQLKRLANNTRASDFRCPSCGFQFQLKGQQSRLGNTITDGAYEAMMHAISTDETPSFYFLHYNREDWSIRNLLLVPSFAFPASAIIKRKPLSANARRAGWVGCNFDLTRIPGEARIPIVTNAQIIPATEVREKFKKVKPLKDISVTQRGWTLDVLNGIRKLGKTEFTNGDAYTMADHLSQLHPDNRHVRDKIRQQLQVLRDAKLLIHVGSGVWRLA